MSLVMRVFFWSLLVLGATGPALAQVGAEIRAMTGSRTRLVWCQDQAPEGSGNDPEVLGDNHKLVGLDSDDGQGERYILPQRSGYCKPLLTDDGNRVVYSNRVTNTVHCVNWDGSNHKAVTSGWATDVWHDPATGVDWVYVRTGNGGVSNDIWRFDLDGNQAGEMVWQRTDVDYGAQVWFQVSVDGTRAAGCFPWSRCGVAELPNRSWNQIATGCWPNISPDLNYRYFQFTDTHYSIDVFDNGGTNKRTVDLRGAPGIGNYDIYFPRWSNHPHFMTMAGPMTVSDPWGGPEVELYLGKFSSDYSRISQWIKVSRNSKADYWGDAWVAAPDPRLVLQPSSLVFTTMMGGQEPESQVVEVTNGGEGTLDAVSVSIEPASATSWLQVERTGQGNAQQLVNSVSTQGLGPGNHQATVSVSCANAPNAPLSYTVVLKIRSELRINCGDNAYDEAGWERDDPFTLGNDFVFPEPIDTEAVSDAAPVIVYQSCISAFEPFDFSFIPDGTYLVRMHFTDWYEPDNRAMEWSVEGQVVLSDFSIIEEAGLNRALVKTFVAEVGDGDGLQIAGHKALGNDVFISGLEILPASDDQAPEVTISSPVDGATVSGQVSVTGTAADENALAEVSWRVDDAAWQPVQGLQSWSASLDTTILAEGVHKLEARATDSFDNTGTHSVQVVVDNVVDPDPVIHILSPAAGDVWPVGAERRIRWTTENLPHATIHYSTDDGTTWEPLVFRIDEKEETWGDLPWIVPDAPSAACRIRIAGYFEEVPTLSDRFEIRKSGDRDPWAVLGGCNCGPRSPASGFPRSSWMVLVLVFSGLWCLLRVSCS